MHRSVSDDCIQPRLHIYFTCKTVIIFVSLSGCDTILCVYFVILSSYCILLNTFSFPLTFFFLFFASFNTYFCDHFENNTILVLLIVIVILFVNVFALQKKWNTVYVIRAIIFCLFLRYLFDVIGKIHSGVLFYYHRAITVPL